MSTLILRTAGKVIVPLSLLFAVHIYLKGHQTPGGGFVAGLVTAVALIVFRMTWGGDALRRLLPAPERTLLGVGLLLAGGAGFGALAAGLPFLTSNYGYLPLPGLDGLPDHGGSFEWATVMIFDLGVMLVVAGVVVGMIDALSRELREEWPMPTAGVGEDATTSPEETGGES